MVSGWGPQHCIKTAVVSLRLQITRLPNTKENWPEIKGSIMACFNEAGVFVASLKWNYLSEEILELRDFTSYRPSKQ